MLVTPKLHVLTLADLEAYNLPGGFQFVWKHELPGYVLCNTFNGERHTIPALAQNAAPRRERFADGLDWYGVCDSVDQFDTDFGETLRSDPRKLVVFFTEVRRDEQPARSGWRWTKWGMYVGRRKPTQQYLHDEPDIESVFVWRIFDTAFTQKR